MRSIVVPSVSERGFMTIGFVYAVAVSLVLLVLATNLLVWQYGRGAVRAALDEGVRSASRAPAASEDCLLRAQSAVDDLMGGALGDDVEVTCYLEGDRVRATAHVRFAAWLPLIPDWSFVVSGSAVKETEP
jgi:hypothetical protein